MTNLRTARDCPNCCVKVIGFERNRMRNQLIFDILRVLSFDYPYHILQLYGPKKANPLGHSFRPNIYWLFPLSSFFLTKNKVRKYNKEKKNKHGQVCG